MNECPKCKGTGLADSGGVQPWGEPILIECDCRIEEGIMEESRKQFEEWCDRNFSYKKGRFCMFRGEYGSQFTRQLFEAWQASRASIEIELPKGMGEHQVQWDGTDWNMMRDHAVNAIRAAGLKIKGE